MPLSLTRKPGQSVKIGDSITVTLRKTTNTSARISIDAPRHIDISRDDMVKRAATTGTLHNLEEQMDAQDNSDRRCHDGATLRTARPHDPAQVEAVLRRSILHKTQAVKGVMFKDSTGYLWPGSFVDGRGETSRAACLNIAHDLAYDESEVCIGQVVPVEVREVAQ